MLAACVNSLQTACKQLLLQCKIFTDDTMRDFQLVTDINGSQPCLVILNETVYNLCRQTAAVVVGAAMLVNIQGQVERSWTFVKKKKKKNSKVHGVQ